MREILKFLGISTKENQIEITFTMYHNTLHCHIYAYDFLMNYNEESIELKESDAYRMMKYLDIHLEDVTQSCCGELQIKVNL